MFQREDDENCDAPDARITQAEVSVTQEQLFKYDSLSRLTHERQVEATATLNDAGVKVGSGGLWTGVYVYDSATGLLKEGYDARGVKTSLTYDGLNRVSTVSFTGETNNQTPTVTYSYDSASSGYFNNGRLTKVETASTSTAPTTSQIYDYDLMGRVSKQQQSIGANGSISAQTYTLEYAYNLAGQLISEKYPSGRRVAYRVDEAGRLSNVFGGGRTYANGFSFAGHGELTSMVYGNGATESFSYNDRIQLVQQLLVKNSSVIQQYDYSYGLVNLSDGSVDTSKNTGQLARVDAFIGSVSSPTKQWQQRFSYDSIGRLEKAKEVRGDNSALVWESKFSYDRFGNRYRKASENPNSLSFTAVEESDVDKATNRISNNTTYDESGNTTTDNKFRNRNYRYDANGRMVWTQPSPSGTESKAVYDALGQRVATQVNGNWRYMVYDIGGKVVAEYGQSSGMSGNNQIRYMMLDRQGSTRVVMDKIETVQARFDYQPFGEEISSGVGMRTTTQGYGSSDSSRQRYALTERDEATGLDHTWWRKYENTAGRWTSPDPYKGSMETGDPQSFNRYSYLGNDPINFVDPSGLIDVPAWHEANDRWFASHGFYAWQQGWDLRPNPISEWLPIWRGAWYRDEWKVLGVTWVQVVWGNSVVGRPAGPTGPTEKEKEEDRKYAECRQFAQTTRENKEKDAWQDAKDALYLDGLGALIGVVGVILGPNGLTKLGGGILTAAAIVSLVKIKWDYDKALARAKRDYELYIEEKCDKDNPEASKRYYDEQNRKYLEPLRKLLRNPLIP